MQYCSGVQCAFVAKPNQDMEGSDSLYFKYINLGIYITKVTYLVILQIYLHRQLNYVKEKIVHFALML